MRTIKDYILLLFKGIAMGGADVIPGVSGGTIAFITGIYDELLKSIKSVDIEALKLLKSARIKAFWEHVNGNFLITLIVGIGISVFSIAKLMHYLLDEHQILTWSFFFGLIIISSIIVAREIEQKNWKTFLAGIIGIVIAYAITELSPAETPDTWWFVFISGAVAICAMILPGISGAFILLILGKYKYVMAAVSSYDIGTISIFIAGCLVGLLSFSRLISWCLDKFKSITVAILSGFMIGSLNKVWPWKVVDKYGIDRHGAQITILDHNVLPHEYLIQTGNNPQLVEAILLASCGILVVVLIEKVALRFKTKSA